MKRETVFVGVLVFLLLAFIAWLYRPGRYQIQTVTLKTMLRVSGGNSDTDFQVTLKIDRLTGRAWILEGSNSMSHEDKWFRQISEKAPARKTDTPRVAQ
jgi:hypothetical protein